MRGEGEMRLHSENRGIINQAQLIEQWNRYAERNHLNKLILDEGGTCSGLSHVFAEYNAKNKKENFIELVKKATKANHEEPDEETKKFIRRIVKSQDAQGYFPKKNEINTLQPTDKHSIIATTSEDIHRLITPLQAGQSTVLSFLNHDIYVGRELDGMVTVYNSNNNEIKSFEDDVSASRFVLENIRNSPYAEAFKSCSSLNII